MELKQEKEVKLVERILAKVVGQELTENELLAVTGGTKASCPEEYWDSIFGCDTNP